MKIKILIISILIVICFSCRKEIVDIDTNTEVEEPIEIPGYVPEIRMITGDLFGQVVDSNDDPINNVKITVGTETKTTDKYGTFLLNNIQMNAEGTLVKAQKDGYVLGTRLFYPEDGEVSRVKIKLITRRVTKVIDADKGGTVDVEGGAKVIFENNSFVKLDGSEYSGGVHVITKYLDPTQESALDEMPGDLIGIRPFQDNEAVALVSYGMLLVELESDSSEKLQLGNDAEAEIIIPIPADRMANAPQEIPLWYFNEDIGRWVEESSASLVGDEYIGKVKHFTFWNCDDPYELVNLKINIKQKNGTPMSNQEVIIGLVEQGIHEKDITDVNGCVGGLVPAGISLELFMYNECGDLAHYELLGSITEDTELEIVLPASAFDYTAIKGEVVCDGVEVSSSILKLEFDGEVTFKVVGNPFEFQHLSCDDEAILAICRFISVEDEQTSREYVIDLNEPNDLGIVDICEEELDEFIRITYNNEKEHTWVNPEITSLDFLSTGGYTKISAEFEEEGMQIIFQGVEEGDYTGEFSVDGYQISKNLVGYDPPENGTAHASLEHAEITRYDRVNGYVEGYFSGTLTDYFTNELTPIVGSFKVKSDDTVYDGSYHEFLATNLRLVDHTVNGEYIEATNGQEHFFANTPASSYGLRVIREEGQANYYYALSSLTTRYFDLYHYSGGGSNPDEPEYLFEEIPVVGEYFEGVYEGVDNNVFGGGVLYDFRSTYKILRTK